MVLSITIHPPMQTHAHAQTHTNATPSAIPLGGNTLQAHRLIEGGVAKTDGKCVNGCVMLWRKATGGVRIPLVFKPQTSINTSEKLLRHSITDPPITTVEY